MARIYSKTLLTQQSEASGTRNFERILIDASAVGTDFKSYQVPVPFKQGIIKRVTLFVTDTSNNITSGEVIISEAENMNRENKVAHYASIDFNSDYLDSEENLFYHSVSSTLFFYIKGNSGSNDFKIKLDIEKVN